jgi:hypothetical protein
MGLLDGLPNGLQQHTNPGPVGRTLTPVEKRYVAAGIYQDVTAQLPNICRRQPGPPALQEATEIGPDCRESKDTVRRPFLEAKCPVSLALRIGQDRKGQLLSPGELLEGRQRLKADGHHLTP